MGVVDSIDYESFPRQGNWVGKRVEVFFKYDTSHALLGTVVRDDREQPFIAIIRLDDGRFVLTTECQHSVPFERGWPPVGEP